MKFTHRQLCEIAAKWLKRSNSANGHGCHIAIVESACYGENPDVIGFRHGLGYDCGSVVLEIKTSRADFFADRNKPHRQDGCGMGKWRYYVCPTDLISPNELPCGWGLVYVNKQGHIKIICGAMFKSNRFGYFELKQNHYIWQHWKYDVVKEISLLTMALNRLSDVEDMLYLQRKLNKVSQKLIMVDSELIKTKHLLKLSDYRLSKFDSGDYNVCTCKD